MRVNERGLPKRERIEEIVIRPKLSLEEAEKKFKGRYLSHDDYDLRPTKSLWGKFADGRTAFIYLTDGLSSNPIVHETTHYAVHRLKFNDVKNSRRAGLKQSKGGELVLGYVNFPFPRAAANTYKQWEEYSRFFFLLQWIGAIVHAYLPEYHAQQLAIAREQMDFLPYMDFHSGNEPGIKKSAEETYKAYKKLLGDKHPVATATFPIFSAFQVNKSTLFRSHADAKNEGGLACLTAFGKWAGGEFCLPRLRVAFPMTPGSILIADNNNEQHGNIGPLVGNRISVVAYLRAMKKAAPKAKAARAGKS
jgi:hypothetical protein